MPHGSLKLIPGIDTVKTPTLNEVAMSESNLIRFLPDRNGFGLAQKLGGWVSWFGSSIDSVVRELHAWQDLNENKWLAVGAENSLTAINAVSSTSKIPSNITPQFKIDNVAPNFTVEGGVLLGEGTQAGNYIIGEGTQAGNQIAVTFGSNIVTVIDPNSDVLVGDVVWIQTQVSVGGGVLFGPYPVYARIDINTYQIVIPFTATVDTTNGGTLPIFTTLSGDAAVNVNMINHGYAVQDVVTFLVSTTVGGVTILGDYLVDFVTDANNFTIRASFAANSNDTETLNGGNVRLYYFLAQGAYGVGSGYGRGGYGRGGYGTGSTSPDTRGGAGISTTDWYLANFGQYLLACPYNGPIYLWQPNGGQNTAQVLYGSPLANAGMFIAMPQRQVIAFGSSFAGTAEPLTIRWSDVGNPNVWVATAINQAGSYTIPEGSKIVAGFQATQQAVFWTDQAVWVMQYTGDPATVYGFNKIGEGVGAISPKSIGVMNNVVYWMSPSQFNLLSTNGVQTIACPVWDNVFQDMNMDIDANGRPYTDRIRCAVNSQFGEITWYYPTADSTENNAYVKYNAQIQQWDYGLLGRTAWTDQSVLGSPIGAGPSPNWIYQHEVGNDAYIGNQSYPMTSSFRTGYFQVGDEGDHLIFVDQVWPDMKWGDYNQVENATVLLTFYGTNYSGDTPTVYGPYSMTKNTQYISTRIRNRLLSIEISSADEGTFWRVGNMRYRFQPDGRF
jgi:hypothetical protein